MIDNSLFCRIILSMKFFILFVLIFSCKPIRNSSQEYDRDISGGIDIEESSEFLAAKGLIDSRCVSCHDNYHSAWKNLSEQGFIKSGYVIAGDPEKSKIYQSLFSGGINVVSSLMPKNDNEFTEDEKKVIADWINSINKEPTTSTSRPTSTTKPNVISPVNGTDEFKRFYNLVERKCIWCHDTNDKYVTSPNFRLTTSAQWLEAVSLSDGQVLIADGDKEGSRFLETIEDGTMPPDNLPQLTANEIKVVEAFIESASVTTSTSTTTTRASDTTTTTQPGDTTTTTRANNTRWIAARGVLNNHCTGCHHATSNNFRTAGFQNGEGLLGNMTEEDFLNLENNENFINKDNPVQSIFYQRTKITGKTPANNTNMPRVGGASDGSDLSAAEGKILLDWIEGL